MRVGPFVIDEWQPYLKRAVSHVITFFSFMRHMLRYDVVIGQGAALFAIFGVLFAKRIPAICVVHDIYGLDESLRSKGILKGVIRHLIIERLLHKLPFDSWIAVSESTMTKLHKMGVPSDRIAIVRNGIDPRMIALDNDRSSRNVIIYLGRLVRHKHPEDFIAAIAHLGFRDSWIAKIVGQGELFHNLRELTHKLNLESKLFFLGRVSDQEKEQLLSSAICLVLPSVAEGWGVVLTEAAARGTPSIAYDVPGVHEQAGLVRSIILVKPRDVIGLARQIERLTREPDLVAMLGELGRRDVANLTWHSSVMQVNTIIRKLVSRRSLSRESTRL